MGGLSEETDEKISEVYLRTSNHYKTGENIKKRQYFN